MLQEEQEWSQAQVQNALLDRLGYLRTRHGYCFYCKAFLEDAACPGELEEDHEQGPDPDEAAAARIVSSESARACLQLLLVFTKAGTDTQQKTC